MSKGAVLIVEPDLSFGVRMSQALREHDYDVDLTADGRGAFDSIEKIPPDVIISALQVPPLNGLSLLSTVRERWPSLRFILLLAIEEISLLAEAMRRGADKVLPRPPEKAELLDAVRSVTRAAASLDRLATEIIGKSPLMAQVREDVAIAARSECSVLITGESGTGKELAADAVHRLSPRGGKKMVKVNCANMPGDLWGSLFFGHRRGAFTGAIDDREGLFEEADGSHIFLDELQSLSVEHQPKFLRVIEDGEVRPLGSQEVRAVSIRFIAATNQDPERMVEEGRLRGDLFYRLCGFVIALPPLRDHPEDIPLLAAHVLRGSEVTLSSDALERLGAEEWPGNVREFNQRVLAAKAVALTSGETTITPAHLDRLRKTSSHLRRSVPGDGYYVLPGTLEYMEEQLVEETLRRTGGNQTEAARRLGINRRTLWARGKQLGIQHKGRGRGRSSRV